MVSYYQPAQVLHLHNWWWSLAASCAGGIFPAAVGTNTPCTYGGDTHCNLRWWYFSFHFHPLAHILHLCSSNLHCVLVVMLYINSTEAELPRTLRPYFTLYSSYSSAFSAGERRNREWCYQRIANNQLCKFTWSNGYHIVSQLRAGLRLQIYKMAFNSHDLVLIVTNLPISRLPNAFSSL